MWDNGDYPIIWFHDEAPCRQFFGDEAELYATSADDDVDDEPINRYVNRCARDSCSGYDDKYDIGTAFSRIEDEMGFQQKFSRYQEVFAESGSVALADGLDDMPLELHCAVVCCDVESRRVLVIHRTSAHETNRGKWEFGCAKASPREHLVQRVVDHYKDAYGVDIELVMDGGRCSDPQPRPIAIYEVGDVPSAHKGVIFVASATKRGFRGNVSHDRCEWMSREELDEINPEEAVNDFHQTLSTVFENFDEFFRRR